MNQEYSIMLLGKLFPHFLLLLNAEREKNLLLKKGVTFNTYLEIPFQHIAKYLCTRAIGLATYTDKGGEEFSVQSTIILISSREI